jgi:hypothetical protein
VNKAHTTTVNRLLRRYAGTMSPDGEVDIQTAIGLIEVETGATISDGVRNLKQRPGPAFLAVTNREALAAALRAVRGSRVGVMDPQGTIIKPAG